MGFCLTVHNETLPETFVTYVNIVLILVLAFNFFSTLRRLNRSSRRALAGMMDHKTITISVYLWVANGVLVWCILYGLYKFFSTSVAGNEALCNCNCPVVPTPTPTPTPPTNDTSGSGSGSGVGPDPDEPSPDTQSAEGWIYHGLSQSAMMGLSTGYEWVIFVLTSSPSLGTITVRRAQRVAVASALVVFAATLTVSRHAHAVDRVTEYGFAMTSVVAGVRAAVGAAMMLRASRRGARPALSAFARLVAGVNLSNCLSTALIALDVDVGNCWYDASLAVYFAAVPPAVFRLCTLESAFWRKALTRGPAVAAAAAGKSWDVRDVEEAAHMRIEDTVIEAAELCYVRDVGHGANGAISLHAWRGRQVVLKAVNVPELTMDYLQTFAEETQLLRRLAHPNVVAFIGTCVDPPQLGIVMELCEHGDLFQVLEATRERGGQQPLGFDPALVARDVALGMQFLHSRADAVIHRDLKSMNVLLQGGDGEGEWRAKIADFGECVSAAHAGGERFATQRCHGTPAWAAPEVLARGPITPKADVYSYGVLLWELLTFDSPFVYVFEEVADSELYTVDDAAHVPLMKSVVAKRRVEITNVSMALDLVVERGERPPVPEGLPRELRELLVACWAPAADQRPAFDDVLDTLDRIGAWGVSLPLGFSAPARPVSSRAAPEMGSLSVSSDPEDGDEGVRDGWQTR